MGVSSRVNSMEWNDCVMQTNKWTAQKCRLGMNVDEIFIINVCRKTMEIWIFLVYCDWHKRLAEEESTEFYVCKLSRSRSTRLSVPRDSLPCVLCQRVHKKGARRKINQFRVKEGGEQKRKKETKEVGNYANALESKRCVKITSFEEEFNSTRQDDWALSRAATSSWEALALRHVGWCEAEVQQTTADNNSRPDKTE